LAEDIASDKELTRQLLKTAGLPVPLGQVVATAREAWEVSQQLGLPVVIKPRDSNHGQGVAVGLTTREQVETAFGIAEAVRPGEQTDVMVEQYIPGSEYRLLVVSGKLVAASRSEPPRVSGDGVHSIRELVAIANRDPNRSSDWRCPLDLLELDSLAELVLADQGFTSNSVPAEGVAVVLQRYADTTFDVTDDVHPTIQCVAVEAAAIVGLDIAGIDFRAARIDSPLGDGPAAIVEVNAGPGLMSHLRPTFGASRPVGEHIINYLFEADDTGRIPLIAVVGGEQAASAARRFAKHFSSLGRVCGLASREGVFIGERALQTERPLTADAVANLLQHPWLEVAVVQVDPQAVAEFGLPFDAASLLVFTNSDDNAGACQREAAQLLLRHSCRNAKAVLLRKPGPALDWLKTANIQWIEQRQDSKGPGLVDSLDSLTVLDGAAQLVASLISFERRFQPALEIHSESSSTEASRSCHTHLLQTG
jgi:cyanophycin synthetase